MDEKPAHPDTEYAVKQVTVGFSRSSKRFPVFSWLIMLTQRTPYSHVYVKYEDVELNRTVYYQASHTLVNYMSEDVFLAQEKVVTEFKFTVSDDSFMAIRQFAIDNAGKPYGTLEILGLAWVQVMMAIGISARNPFRESGQTWVCDQLVASMLETCENVKLPMPVDDLTPRDVFNLVSTLPSELA